MNDKLKVLDMVLEDTPKDAKALDGKPFNGKIVAEQFGVLYAQLEAVTKVVKLLVLEVEDGKS